MRILLLALVLVLPMPLAAADCVGPACAEESSFGPSSCTQPGDYGAASTSVSVADASVTGSSYCYNDGETGEGSGNGITVAAAGRALLWAGFNGSCGMFLYSGEDVTVLPCAAAPPNPGWGNVLP